MNIKFLAFCYHLLRFVVIGSGFAMMVAFIPIGCMLIDTAFGFSRFSPPWWMWATVGVWFVLFYLLLFVEHQFERAIALRGATPRA